MPPLILTSGGRNRSVRRGSGGSWRGENYPKEGKEMQCPFCNEEVFDGARKCKHCGAEIQRSMKKWQAFALAIILTFVLGAIITLSGSKAAGHSFMFATAVWASFDARKIGAGKYASRFFTASPGNVLVGSVLLWIVVIPWYLYYRSHVLAGTVPVATEGPSDANCDMAAERDTLNH
jgi:uncharacterized protein (DUF983 family)